MERESAIRGRGKPPLYLQLAEEILGGIRRGELLPGDRVASEPELVKRHQVSRATAVRALEHLERTGVIRREQGRCTFVEEPRLVQRRPLLGSFTDQVGRLGHVPTQRLVELGPLPRDGDLPGASAWFGAGVDLVRIVRLRLVDGEPVGLHATALPRDIAGRAGIDEDAFKAPDASLYALLDAADVGVVMAQEHLRALPASARVADLLELSPGTALMQVLRVSYGVSGTPIEVTDARYAGERFDYSVSLVRPRSKARSLRADTGGKDESGLDPGAGPGDERRGGGGWVRQVG